MHNYSKMNRRNSRFTPIFSFMGAVLLMGYGYYIYTNQSSEIITAHDNLDTCNGNRKVLKEQLKVVYKHTAKLEEALRKEKENHHTNKQECVTKIKDFELNLTKSKHEAMNRFNALDTNFKMLKANNDELNENHIALQQQYVRLSADHKRITEAAKKDYETLKSAKETESIALQNRIQELFNAKVQYQEQAKLNREYYEKTLAEMKAATDLTKDYMDRIRLYENQLVIYKDELRRCRRNGPNKTENAKLLKQPEVLSNNGTDTIEEDTNQKQKKDGEYVVEIARNSDDKKRVKTENTSLNPTRAVEDPDKKAIDEKIVFTEHDKITYGRYHVAQQSLNSGVQLIAGSNQRQPRDQKSKNNTNNKIELSLPYMSNEGKAEMLNFSKDLVRKMKPKRNNKEQDFNGVQETQLFESSSSKTGADSLIPTATISVKGADESDLSLNVTKRTSENEVPSLERKGFKLGDLLRNSVDQNENDGVQSLNTNQQNIDGNNLRTNYHMLEADSKVQKTNFKVLKTLVGLYDKQNKVVESQNISESDKVNTNKTTMHDSKENKGFLERTSKNESNLNKQLDNNDKQVNKIPLQSPIKKDKQNTNNPISKVQLPVRNDKNDDEQINEYQNKKEHVPLRGPIKENQDNIPSNFGDISNDKRMVPLKSPKKKEQSSSNAGILDRSASLKHEEDNVNVPLKPPRDRNQLKSPEVKLDRFDNERNLGNRKQLKPPVDEIETINGEDHRQKPVGVDHQLQAPGRVQALHRGETQEDSYEDGEENEVKDDGNDADNDVGKENDSDADDGDEHDDENIRESESELQGNQHKNENEEEKNDNDFAEPDEVKNPLKVNKELKERLDVKGVTLEDDEKGDQNLDQNVGAKLLQHQENNEGNNKENFGVDENEAEYDQ